MNVRSAAGDRVYRFQIEKAERVIGKPFEEWRTPDDIRAALDSFKNLAPDLLDDLWREKRIDKSLLQQVLLDVWRYTDHTSVWSARWWRSLFRETGFLSDGAARPSRPLTVYRGCTSPGRRGFSWTVNRARAEWFADHWFKHGYADPGHLYRLGVKPCDVLAIISGRDKVATLLDGKTIQYGGEDEVIVDARYTIPVLIETAQQRGAKTARAEEACQRRFERLNRIAKNRQNASVPTPQ
jgi:hypothetical protein